VPRLSIVIPCLGGAAEFDGTLVSVLQNRPADCEVLVVHAEPYDDPYDLAHEVRFVEAPRRSLVELINSGLQQVRGEIVHVLACGLEVAEGWTAAAVRHFDDAEIAAVSPVILDSDHTAVVAAGVRWSLGGARVLVSDQRVLSAGAGRLRTKILGPTLPAGYYRRDVLLALGGFEPSLGDELADVGLALDIEALGLLSVCERSSQIVQQEEPKQANSGPALPGRAAQRLFHRHAARRGLAASLAVHPVTVACDWFQRAARLNVLGTLVGRAMGLYEMAMLRDYQQRLETARQRLAAASLTRSNSQPRLKIVPAPTDAKPGNYRRAA
jgi:hypothetical protein